MQLSKEECARKRIHDGCLVRIEIEITRDSCLASLEMQNGNPHDGIFNPHLTTIKGSYILSS